MDDSMTMYKMKCLGFVVEATQKKVQRYQHDSTRRKHKVRRWVYTVEPPVTAGPLRGQQGHSVEQMRPSRDRKTQAGPHTPHSFRLVTSLEARKSPILFHDWISAVVRGVFNFLKIL